jgi:two-component system sensor histidine kinase UhpB
MARKNSARPEDLHRKLGELQKQSEDPRRTARNLHPVTLTHLGLEPALQAYCDEFSKLPKIKVRLMARALPGTIPSAVALGVYRVVQEAPGNVARHAAAKRAELAISGSDDVLDVAIRDDGHGFDPDHAKGQRLASIGMEERVRHLGGPFSISPKRGDGARIEIRIPVAAESSTP